MPLRMCVMPCVLETHLANHTSALNKWQDGNECVNVCPTYECGRDSMEAGGAF